MRLWAGARPITRTWEADGARLILAEAAREKSFPGDDAVATRRVLLGSGEPEELGVLVAEHAVHYPGNMISVPRGTMGSRATNALVNEGVFVQEWSPWVFMWCAPGWPLGKPVAEPPLCPGVTVERVDISDPEGEVAQTLKRAFPTASTWPGEELLAAWFVARETGEVDARTAIVRNWERRETNDAVSSGTGRGGDGETGGTGRGGDGERGGTGRGGDGESGGTGRGGDSGTAGHAQTLGVVAVELGERGRAPLLCSLAVVPEARRRGIGARLLVEATHEALRLSYDSAHPGVATLGAYADGEATIAMYERLGYVKERVVESYRVAAHS